MYYNAIHILQNVQKCWKFSDIMQAFNYENKKIITLFEIFEVGVVFGHTFYKEYLEFEYIV